MVPITLYLLTYSKSLTIHLSHSLEAAKMFRDDYNLPFDVICDSMVQDNLLETYDSYPDRLYIVVNNVLVWKSGRGPFFYEPKEVKDWLEKRYSC